MPHNGNITRRLFNAAIFIIMEIAALGMLSNNGSLQNLFISKNIHAIQGFVSNSIESVTSYFSLKSANKELSEENFNLYVRLKSLNYQTEAIKFNSKKETIGNYSYRPAAISKIKLNSQHNFFILDKGSADGVVPQSGVITEKGAVGIIDAVGEHYSYAVSFMNTDMNISARLGKEGPVGSLEWDGKHTNKAVLKEITLQHEVMNGDIVYTSGYSLVFPPDIPLGIVGEHRIVNGATYEIEIELLQDFRSLKNVMIVNNIEREEIEHLEKSNNNEK